jgi:outer membrane protein assembly factor BamB
MPLRRYLFLLSLLLLLPALQAEDWSQWRGKSRDGISPETGLLKSWPKEGPKLLWKITDAGAGFSGPAIVGQRLYTMGLRGDTEYVLCYNLADGKEVWKFANGGAYRNSYGDGPRCTPTIDGERLYALGGNGDLCCLETATGKQVWKQNILQEYDGQNITWGISESPLIEGEMCIVTPGGSKATMVALDKKTGKLLWTSKDPSGGTEPAGYASPIAFTVDGERQVATFTSKGAYGVRARDGQFLWRYDQVANNTANIATPIFQEGKIFFTSDYGTGCTLLNLKAGGPATEVYFNRTTMRNHHGGVVLIKGALYGFNSNQLACVDWATGKRLWQDRSVGKGSLCAADGYLYLLSEDGMVGLALASPQGYREISRFELPNRSEKPSWTHPVISGGKLFLRDQQNIFCYDVRGQ